MSQSNEKFTNCWAANIDPEEDINSSLLKAPGPFRFDEFSFCQFCENPNKIPVILNNNLSTQIKMIPLRFICEEAGISKHELQEVLKEREKDDYIVQEYFDEIICKDLFLTFVPPSIREILERNIKNGYEKLPLPKFEMRFTLEDTLEILNQPDHPDYVADSRLVANLITNKRHGINQNYDSKADKDKWNPNYAATAITLTLDKYKCRLNRDNNKDANDTAENVEDKAMNICRQKDPYLQEINFAIFCNRISPPKENTDEYYQMAQEYALSGTKPTFTNMSYCKKDYSPAKEMLAVANDVTDSNTQDCANIFTAVDNNKNDTTQQPIIPTSIMDTQNFSTYQHNDSLPSHSPYLNTTTNTYPQLPIIQQQPSYLTPQQLLMQSAQMNYQSTNIQQSLIQHQANYSNYLQSLQYFNASFKETQINTIVQHHQYELYNGLAANRYEMLVYEQMLHQSQQIAFVARNQVENQLQFDASRKPRFRGPTTTATNYQKTFPIATNEQQTNSSVQEHYHASSTAMRLSQLTRRQERAAAAAAASSTNHYNNTQIAINDTTGTGSIYTNQMTNKSQMNLSDDHHHIGQDVVAITKESDNNIGGDNSKSYAYPTGKVKANFGCRQ